MTNLQSALSYAVELGWPVFPVWPMRGDTCACGGAEGCKSGKNAGKHPISALVEKGHNDATTNPATIRRWWTEYPDANVAVHCADAGIVVVDVDPRNGGDATWTALGIPDSDVTAATGGGGRHHFYAEPEDDVWFRKLRGIDIKYRGYVLLPPSNHRSGTPYAWLAGCAPEDCLLLSGTLPPLPDCFVEGVADAGPVEAREPLTFKPGQMERDLDILPISDFDYDDWIRLGQALHHQFGGSQEGFDLWLKHTRRSAKFTGEDQVREMRRIKWRSFGRSRKIVTMGTVRAWAAEARQADLLDQFDEEPAAFETVVPAAASTDDDFDDLLGGATAAATGSPDPDDDIEAALSEALAPGATDTSGSVDLITLLEVNEEGGIKPTLHNIEMIVRHDPRLVGLAQLNEFTQETVQRTPPGRKSKRRRNEAKETRQLDGRVWDVRDTLNGELWSDDRDFAVRSILEAPKTQGGYGVKVSDRDLKAAIALAANGNAFHPVREYLNGLSWDQTPRVDRLWVDYVNAPDDPYHRDVARLMMVAAVTRIFEPAHKFDFATILEGLQGKRKSTLISVLGRRWFAELDGDFHDPKQMVELMQGAWIMEIPELTGFSRSDVRSIKAFISRQRDRARLAYARRAGEFPRQCIFVGSTNDREYLKDDTGGRRFWPVACRLDIEGEIDTDRLEREIDHLWAEAVALYRAMRTAQPRGTLPLYLTNPQSRLIAARLQESRRVESPDDVLAGRIADWLDRPISEGGMDEEDGRLRDETCTLQIWVEMLGGDQKTFKTTEQGMVNRAMARVPGWASDGTSRRFVRYGKQRVFYRGGEAGKLARMGLGDLLENLP